MSAPLKKKAERLVFGVGHKDPSIKVTDTKDGKFTWKCPYYVLWTSIMRRCYSPVFLAKNPSYLGYEVVVVEWHNFYCFKLWAKNYRNVMGFLSGNLELDKDLLGGGKLYSPASCVFIPKKINGLFNNRGGDGVLPLGVHFNAHRQGYVAQISNQGTREYLGIHKTPESAHRAWQQRKMEILLLTRRDYLLSQYQDHRVAEVIAGCAKMIAEDIGSGRITHKTLRINRWHD